MKSFLWNLAHWIVLASIAWATYFQPSYGPQLLDAASIWVGIINALLLLLFTLLLGNKEFNQTWQQQRLQRKTWQKVHSTMLSISELIVFAWAGWLWSFGIRLTGIFILQIAAGRPDKDADTPNQARH